MEEFRVTFECKYCHALLDSFSRPHNCTGKDAPSILRRPPHPEFTKFLDNLPNRNRVFVVRSKREFDFLLSYFSAALLKRFSFVCFPSMEEFSVAFECEYCYSFLDSLNTPHSCSCVQAPSILRQPPHPELRIFLDKLPNRVFVIRGQREFDFLLGYFSVVLLKRFSFVGVLANESIVSDNIEHEINENTTTCNSSSLCGFDKVCEGCCRKERHTQLVSDEEISESPCGNINSDDMDTREISLSLEMRRPEDLRCLLCDCVEHTVCDCRNF